jgi:predicted DCC family thiol-disulfide oxidoreductase YuxK
VSDSKRALMVFDGDCGFCRSWIQRWRQSTGDRVDYQPFQRVAEQYPEVPRQHFAEAVHFRSAAGEWSRGAEAVFRAGALGPGGGPGLWLYRHVPPFRALSEAAYRFVARRRPLATRMTDALWGDHVVPPGERLTVWLLARVFGLIALAAFLSLWVQIVG